MRIPMIAVAAAGLAIACAAPPPPQAPPSEPPPPAEPEIEHSDPSHDLKSDVDATPGWTATLGIAPRVKDVVETRLPATVHAERGLLVCRYYVADVDRKALIRRNREADVRASFEFSNGESATAYGKRNTSNGIVSLPNAPLLGQVRVELGDRNFFKTRRIASFSLALGEYPATDESESSATLTCRAAPESWAVEGTAEVLDEADAALRTLEAKLENGQADFSTDPPFGTAQAKLEEAAAFLGWGHALITPRTARYAELREAWITAALESQPVRTVNEAIGAVVPVSSDTSVRIDSFECADGCVVELTANHGEPEGGLVRAVELKWVDAQGSTEAFDEEHRTQGGAEVDRGLFVRQRGEVVYRFVYRRSDRQRFRFLRVQVQGGRLDLEPPEGQAPAQE